MKFDTFQPSPALGKYIREYWIINSEENSEIIEQKIIPDGCPELILHFRDAYEINISGHWEVQDSCLLAGQIRQHFTLRNTGRSAMLGIKFQPAAIHQIFGIDMSTLVDKVVPMPVEHRFVWESLVNDPNNINNPENIIAFIEEHLLALVNMEATISNEEKVLIHLVDSNGAVSLKELYQAFSTSERKLERYFKSHVGLSPKFYSRILRFAYIFKLVEKHEKNWPAITYHAGFYDQPHFIKNFKEFTGEEPSCYGFSEETMANFFLNS